MEAPKYSFGPPPSLMSTGGPNVTSAYSGQPVQITNEITVQGNATAQTAREIGKEAGNATASSIGRDRSAIGASFGMSQ